MRNVFRVLLFVLALVGLILLIRQRQVLSEVKIRHERLTAKYGVLEIQDPDKYVIKKLETDDPDHFLWRCYFPAGMTIKEVVSQGSGGLASGSSFRRDASEALVRCRFEFEEEWAMVDYMDRAGGGRMSFASGDLLPFVREHWGEMEFDAIADQGSVELATDQPLPFLTIRLPGHLVSELPEHLQERYASGVIFQMLYGTEQAVTEYQQQQSGAVP